MSKRNDDELVYLLIIIGIPALLLFLLSQKLGADFTSTAKMVAILLLTSCLVWGFNHVQSPGFAKLGSAFSIGAWLSFWPILGSWARGGLAADDPKAAFHFGEHPVWDGAMFKWGILAVLIGFFIWLLWKDDY